VSASRFRGKPAWACLFLSVFAILVPLAAQADDVPPGGMLQHPTISEDHVAFVYGGDLWLVGRDGGLATPIAGPAGVEQRPRFSPDGETLAFSANYDGGRDLYTVPVSGGTASRVTHHPSGEVLQEWTRDGRLVYFARTGFPRGNPQLWTVSAEGGLPEKMVVEHGAMASVSADGRHLAFTPHTRDHRTWKRYRGGMATDIWIYDLREDTAERVTDWEGTDTEPMWVGDKLYYVSDMGDEARWNIWMYDPDSGERSQVTKFRDFDVKNPSHGAGMIVFQLSTGIHVLDPESRDVEQIEVRIPGDRPKLRARAMDVSDQIFGWDVSPTGKRMLVEMRGDIWSIPASKGVPVNLTRSGDQMDRYASWSPDGRWIAWLHDGSGEYEIHLMQSDGAGEVRQLGNWGGPHRMGVSWSPDSETLAYEDNGGRLYLIDVESGNRRLVFEEENGNNVRLSWSHDSAWITWSASAPDMLQSAIYLHEVATGETEQVTSGMFNDNSPVFDREGKWLYYTSNRDFSSPTYEDVGTTFVYDNTAVVLMVPLRDDVALPNLPTDEKEEWDDESEEDKADEDEVDDEESEGEDDDAEEEDEEEAIVIALEGFEARAMPVGMETGSVFALNVTHDGKLIFVQDGDVKLFDPHAEEPEVKDVISGTRGYSLTADGKKIMVRQGKRFAVVEAAPDQKMDEAVSVEGYEASVDPREEWMQIYTDAWRLMRDFFYDPTMHGTDWDDIHDQYAEMVPHAGTREDINFIIKEMISELNVGHAYLNGGDFEDQPRRNVGMLGVDFEVDKGGLKIAKIYEGAAWDSDARSPLRMASGEVNEGDFLIAVNGVDVDVSADPWSYFVNTAGEVTRLTVSAKPRRDDEAREVLVTPLSSDSRLRYRHWIESNRQYVQEKTDGRVGYIYVPNTGISGQNDLFRQFYGQRHCDALIIDERWNGGGQIPTRFVELLNRPITNYWAVRDGKTRRFPWPPDAHVGPKCMLINGLAGSGGDAFPAYFKGAGLGKLIGERTWGGLVGISGYPPLMDGARIRVPSFAYYDKDGTWGIEGHGVDPDIEVVPNPARLAGGVDEQLDRGIAEMLAEIQANPVVAPPVPDYPDRSGMGIEEEDK
jgi:tricorn protease